jgi:hypothetical protein
MSLLFCVVALSVFLYVFPPWKIKTVADGLWTAGKSVGHVALKVASEEQKAQKFLTQIAKSGRDLWSSVQDEAGTLANSVHSAEPIIQVI